MRPPVDPPVVESVFRHIRHMALSPVLVLSKCSQTGEIFFERVAMINICMISKKTLYKVRSTSNRFDSACMRDEL